MLSRDKALLGRTPRAAAVAIVAVALLAFAAANAPSASAHAAYDHSTPGDGEVVATAPKKLDVYFKQEIQRAGGLPSLLVVTDEGDVVSEEAVLDDGDRTHMSVELDDLQDGRYAVIWHNVSADDGEEAQGAFHFYVGAGPTSGASGAPTAQATITPVPSTPATDDDDSGDIPLWGVIAGILGGVVVGGAAGTVIGRQSRS